MEESRHSMAECGGMGIGCRRSRSGARQQVRTAQELKTRPGWEAEWAVPRAGEN